MENYKNQWEESYKRKENFLFYPHEEIIRFFSKYISRRTGPDSVELRVKNGSTPKVLDLGCGIGRHVVFSHQMKAEAYGVDLSEEAVSQARAWASNEGVQNVNDKIITGDISKLPYAEGTFDFIVSHGVLDSMPLDICRKAVAESSRILKKDGLFYCDIVSGDDSSHYKEFSGEEIVQTQHEKDTVQLYFNYELILETFAPHFQIKECLLIRKENVDKPGFISRYHLVLQKQ